MHTCSEKKVGELVDPSNGSWFSKSCVSWTKLEDSEMSMIYYSNSQWKLSLYKFYVTIED